MISNKNVTYEIENETPLCFNICDDIGQIFENVKHMKWFFDEVKEALEELEEDKLEEIERNK